MMSFALFYIIACLIPTFIFGKMVFNMLTSLDPKNDLLSAVITSTFIGFICLDIYAFQEYKWYEQAFKPIPWTYQVLENPFTPPEEEQ